VLEGRRLMVLANIERRATGRCTGRGGPPYSRGLGSQRKSALYLPQTAESSRVELPRPEAARAAVYVTEVRTCRQLSSARACVQALCFKHMVAVGVATSSPLVLAALLGPQAIIWVRKVTAKQVAPDARLASACAAGPPLFRRGRGAGRARRAFYASPKYI